MPDIGVDRIGEVHRRGADGQGDDLAVGCEHVDLLQLQVGLQVGHEGARIIGLGLPLHDPRQPGHLVGRRLGLVVPVGGHAVLGPGVHLDRPQLELHLLALRTHDGRVEGLVEVELGHRHVVLEPALHRLPGGVDRPQGGVAVPHAFDDDAYAHQVVDLFERPPLHDHLLVDAPELLGAAGHRADDSQLGQATLHLADQLGQVEVPLR